MRVLLHIIILLGLNVQIHAQFTQVITNTNAILNEISILDDNIVINGRTDYYGISYDECENLNSVSPPGNLGSTNAYLNRLNENIAYIISNSGSSNITEIYKTIDGGHNWVSVFDSTGIIIGQLVMFDSLEGLAFSTNYTMYRTVNGGQNWTPAFYPYLILTEAKKMNDSVVCIGTNEGYAYSINRGQTWNTTGFIQSVPRDFCFLSQDTILGIADGVAGRKFFKSLMHGENWTYTNLPNTFTPYALTFLRFDLGFIVGSNPTNGDKGSILRTEDFGSTWIQYDTDFNSQFWDIEFINDSIALISGTNGLLLKYNYRDHHLGFEPIYLSESQMNLFPNPTTGLQELHIQGAVNTPVQIKLLDITGKALGILFQGDIHESQKIQVDLSAYPSGIYFISVQMGEQVQVLKTQKL